MLNEWAYDLVLPALVAMNSEETFFSAVDGCLVWAEYATMERFPGDGRGIVLSSRMGGVQTAV